MYPFNSILSIGKTPLKNHLSCYKSALNDILRLKKTPYQRESHQKGAYLGGMGGYDETDDAEPCHPTSAISEVWAFEAIFSSRRVVCSNLSLNCPISSACFLIIMSRSSNIAHNLSSARELFRSFSCIVAKSFVLVSLPSPVITHTTLTLGYAAKNLVNTSSVIPVLLSSVPRETPILA